jgi:hypothetical protein
MAGKVSAVMNHEELMQLIADHYTGEVQTLTLGAKENWLKLAILRGTITAVQQLSHIAASLEAIKIDVQQSDTGDLIRSINHVAAAMHLLSKTWTGDHDIKEGAKEKQ